MDQFIINGGKPLHGAVRLGGAKNASFKLMIAAALADSGQESRLLNLSHIGDVEVTKKTLEELGLHISTCGERTLFIRTNGSNNPQVPQFAGEKSRGSTLFAGFLLSKLGEAIIPMPGGCCLGVRPVDRHLEALKSLGAHVEYKDNYIHLACKQLVGSHFRFNKKTHTGTEAMIIAAVKAEGKTVIDNAGLEPEIDDLITFLNKMGAKIKREAGDKIIIDGVKHLKGAIHRVMPDRNEAVSYAVAAIATKGDIVVENACKKDLECFLQKLEEAGGKFEISDYGIRFWYDGQLKATDIKTAPEPGFMTDWQPLWGILMTQAQGESSIIEAVHNNRLQYTHQLNQMGAKIELYNPSVDNPENYYEFDWVETDQNMHAAKIIGPTPLKAGDHQIPDLRAGATLTIASLIAQGRSVLSNISHIDRGYEELDERLRQLGADIVRA
ncbi:UDP-N-acetylglucosamine 1-carboxyvinyltransferase [Candidatus Beckwithbacteria bacterium]|nr:UDP-N-acetylglucosamine 1-carboxyvinyltransferase [Candidatus Beckwithbacteria bacterium]